MQQYVKRTIATRVRRPAARRGGAIVELAFALPVVALLVCGALDACTMIFIKDALNTASYEACRVAVNERTTSAEAIEVALGYLESFAVRFAEVSTTPPEIAAAEPGEPVTVRVMLPASQAEGLFLAHLFSSTLLSGETTMLSSAEQPSGPGDLDD